LPSLALAGVSLLRRPGLLRFLIVVPALAVALNAGHLARNVRYFGSALGSDRALYYNQTLAPAALLSNVVRNRLVHLVTPSHRVNSRLMGLNQRIHRALGVDPNDPRTTFIGLSFTMGYHPEEDDVAGAPIHLVLGAALLLGGLWLRRSKSLLWTYLWIPYGAF